MGESDEHLLAGAARGDTEALSTLLKRHGPPVGRGLVISRKWRSVLDPEDVMQVTYLEAFLRIGAFEPRGSESFQAWLREIAQNNLRDAIKGLNGLKRPPPDRRVSPPGGDESIVALYELLGVTSTTPSRVASKEEAKTRLEAAIAELPRDYATAVRLHNLEGRTGPEVAEAMGRSRGAVFMLLARAHDRLRERLGPASQFFTTRGL
jgi:RNA polymerase sigma-70 factor (ECF subfamily)